MRAEHGSNRKQDDHVPPLAHTIHVFSSQVVGPTSLYAFPSVPTLLPTLLFPVRAPTGPLAPSVAGERALPPMTTSASAAASGSGPGPRRSARLQTPPAPLPRHCGAGAGLGLPSGPSALGSSQLLLSAAVFRVNYEFVMC